MPYTSTRKKIAATAVAIDACDQKITPQLRRKTMQWLRRRSEPCELRAALFLAPWLLSESDPRGDTLSLVAAAFPIRTKWLGALFTYVRHSVPPRHSYRLPSYTDLVWDSINKSRVKTVSQFAALGLGL